MSLAPFQTARGALQDPFRAIVRPAEVMIFEPRRGVVAAVANEAAAQSNSPAFALAVLDVLLSRAVSHSRHKLTRLCSAVDCALDDISLTLRRSGASASGEAFARLVPLTKALAALASDVAEVQEAMQRLGSDEEALRALGEGAHFASLRPPDTWEAFSALHGGNDETQEEKEQREADQELEEGVAEAKSMLTTYLRQARQVPHSPTSHHRPPPSPSGAGPRPPCGCRCQRSQASSASSGSTSPPPGRCGSFSWTARGTASTGSSCR